MIIAHSSLLIDHCSLVIDPTFALKQRSGGQALLIIGTLKFVIMKPFKGRLF
jgi:hypothetical protein